MLAVITRANSRTYGYDALNRLTWDSGVSSTDPTYTYDGNGNRTHREATVSGFYEQDFGIETGSNRFDTYAPNGGWPSPVTYDGMGNVTGYGLFSPEFTYDAGGRLASIWNTNSIVGLQMAYNGMGELARSRRYTIDACTSEEVLQAMEYFMFAPDGRALTMVSGNSSWVESDWIWLNDQPVAQFTDSDGRRAKCRFGHQIGTCGCD